MSELSRRLFLSTAAATAAVSVRAGRSLAGEEPAKTATPVKKPAFRFCLNTSTIRGQKVGLVQEVELAAKAGYDGIEPWIGGIETFVKEGGSLSDLRKRIADHGLNVESAIGFAKWIVDNEDERRAGLEQAKRDMDLVAQLGGSLIAAPPVGATGKDVKVDLFRAAERYRALLEVGAAIGVIPQCEVWGFSNNLSRLGETMLVCVEAGHPQACILPDVYHIHKGGSDFAGLRMIAGAGIRCFHMNDYPADPPRAMIADKDRVYPGDGVAPLGSILRTLAEVGFNGALSLELFNPGYWAQPAEEVVTTGLRKMKESVEKAFG